MILLGFIILQGAGSAWTGLSPDVFEVHELHHITSPTTILRVEKQIFLGADYLSPRPGLYRLSFEPNEGYRAGLLKILPRQAVEGLQLMENGELLVVSGRNFTVRPEDWNGRLIALEPRQHQLAGITEITEPDNICSDGSRDCGLVDVVFLSENQLLAFTKGASAKAHLLIRESGGWALQKSVPVFSEQKAATISEVKRINGRIICLVKNRWQLAECLPERVTAEDSWRLVLEPVFDFRPIRKKFGIEDPTLYFYGLAEGFDFDVAGSLLVLLNNRGYAFRKSPDGKLGLSPRILLFPKKKSPAIPAPEPGQNSDNR